MGNGPSPTAATGTVGGGEGVDMVVEDWVRVERMAGSRASLQGKGAERGQRELGAHGRRVRMTRGKGQVVRTDRGAPAKAAINCADDADMVKSEKGSRVRRVQMVEDDYVRTVGAREGSSAPKRCPQQGRR